MRNFEALPRRIFLDSSTLQTLRDYGGFIWENEPLNDGDRILRRTDGVDQLIALRNIFHVNTRAGFEFALSENSLREADQKRDPGHLRWAYDVMDHWSICEAEAGGSSEGSRTLAMKLDGSPFGYLGRGDRELIKDAVALRCDAFLTMESKLPKNAAHLSREVHLLVLTPVEHWHLLEPFSNLWL